MGCSSLSLSWLFPSRLFKGFRMFSPFASSSLPPMRALSSLFVGCLLAVTAVIVVVVG
jgi:hypothetical protein